MMTSSDSVDDMPLACLTTVGERRPSIGNSLEVMDTDDDFIDSDYFPFCDFKGCKQDCHSLCDKCSLVLCKDHASKGSCEDGHNIDAMLKPISEELILNKKHTDELAQELLRHKTTCGGTSTRPNHTDVNPNVNKSRNDESVNSCEIGICKGKVYIGCPLCFRYLCWDHSESLCVNDHQFEVDCTVIQGKTYKKRDKISNLRTGTSVNLSPESFTVHGNRKEGTSESVGLEKRKKGVNKQKKAKDQRDKGEE